MTGQVIGWPEGSTVVYSVVMSRSKTRCTSGGRVVVIAPSIFRPLAPETPSTRGTKVVLTPAAADVVRRVREDQPGRSLSLVIGNGCCDGTAPFLFADYMAGPTERSFGEA